MGEKIKKSLVLDFDLNHVGKAEKIRREEFDLEKDLSVIIVVHRVSKVNLLQKRDPWRGPTLKKINSVKKIVTEKTAVTAMMTLPPGLKWKIS